MKNRTALYLCCLRCAVIHCAVIHCYGAGSKAQAPGSLLSCPGQSDCLMDWPACQVIVLGIWAHFSMFRFPSQSTAWLSYRINSCFLYCRVPARQSCVNISKTHCPAPGAHNMTGETTLMKRIHLGLLREKRLTELGPQDRGDRGVGPFMLLLWFCWQAFREQSLIKN